jgi:hypothetical protein
MGFDLMSRDLTRLIGMSSGLPISLLCFLLVSGEDINRANLFEAI